MPHLGHQNLRAKNDATAIGRNSKVIDVSMQATDIII